MNKKLREFIEYMLHSHYIGGRHIPENLLLKRVKAKTSKKEFHEFEKEYAHLVNAGQIIRMKKRTGKGYDYHISLEPKEVSSITDSLSQEGDGENGKYVL